MDKAKLKEYFYGNVASVFWSFFLLTGGAIFVSYYAYIGYMPDFDFKSAAVILSAAAITAFITIAVFMVVLIMPGAFWVETWANQSVLRPNWENEKREKLFLATSLWFSVPIFAYFIGFVIAFYSLVFLGFYAISIIVFCYILGCKKFGLQGKCLHLEVWKMLGTSFVCTMLAFFPLYLVVTLSFSGVDTSKGPSTWVGIMVAISILFMNMMATMKPKSVHGFVFYSGLGFVAFFIVFASFEIFHRIPERVMEIYKFGAITNASIVFDKEACETLKEYGLVEYTDSQKQCLLEQVNILSRLGNEIYLEKDNLRIAISNSGVLSWSTGLDFNKSIQSTANASTD